MNENMFKREAETKKRIDECGAEIEAGSIRSRKCKGYLARVAAEKERLPAEEERMKAQQTRSAERVAVRKKVLQAKLVEK
jgi:hypothetical protein